MQEVTPLGVIHNLEITDLPPVDKVMFGPHQVYVVPVKKAGPVKLDLIFPAGRYFEQEKSVAYSANALLKEGCHQYTSEQISEVMEFYGAAFSHVFSFDWAGISLLTLDKHWSKLWPMVRACLLEPVFPQSELDLFVRMNLEELKLEEDQTEFLAYRQLTQLLFGAEHPYGYNSSAATYLALNRSKLGLFHQDRYLGTPFKAVICAYDPEPVLRQLEELVNLQADPNKRLTPTEPYPEERPPREEYVQLLKGKMQSSIRWGLRIPFKTQQDFCEIFILNTIFGGYFGSRLIERIREKEGMSYQVFSSVDTMQHGAYWMLGADVAQSNVAKTNQIIREELTKLQVEPVQPKELLTAKNYLLGQLMNNLDGPINISELLRSLLCEGQDFCYIKKLINVIKDVTAADLQRIAIKYANWPEFTQVRVG